MPWPWDPGLAIQNQPVSSYMEFHDVHCSRLDMGRMGLGIWQHQLCQLFQARESHEPEIQEEGSSGVELRFNPPALDVIELVPQLIVCVFCQ